MTDRDRQRLIGVHPALVSALKSVFEEMEIQRAPMFVVEGVRTAERQADLYAKGRSIPGKVVTYKDGVTHVSNHQAHADGQGYAVDCAFVDAEPFNADHPWETFGEALEAHGMFWGGRWKMADMPHAELPEGTV